MTMKISEVAPYEALLVDLAHQLSTASSTAEQVHSRPRLLQSEAARTMLATLTRSVNDSTNYVSLTKEQIETYLEFDPAFADEAKTILREFIERKERE